MKLSLRKARKIEGMVAKRANELSTDLAPTVALSVYKAPAPQLEAAQEKFRQGREVLIRLIGIRYLLRDLIGQANAEQGINTVLTAKERLEASRALFAKWADAPVAADEGAEVLEARFTQQKKLLEQGGDRYSRPADTLPAAYLTPVQIQEFKDLEVQYRRDIANIEEQLIRINNTATVELPDADAEFLAMMRII